jgi:hypothetical protein
MRSADLRHATPEPRPNDHAGVGEVHSGIQLLAVVKDGVTLPIAYRNLRAELQIPYLTFTSRKIYQRENCTIELY